MEERSNNKASSSQFRQTEGEKPKSNAIEVPSISLPKGGGAIKGIDEKFSVNAVNGTASFSIPLPFSPARGASPALSLSYNSGSGNGIFGLGWNLSLTSIKRKTDKGLPRYQDAIDPYNVDSDIFLFSEAEDLVAEFQKETVNGKEQLISNADGECKIRQMDSSNGNFVIRFYRPRIEGLFARIERWTDKTFEKSKWRVISKDNVTTLFGWTEASRISDPVDPSQIYEWLPEFVFDGKGNCTQYIYKKEDKIGFDESLIHNCNRLKSGDINYTNLYIDRILYGNRTPYKEFGQLFPNESDYLFQTVFDYGSTNNAGVTIDQINPWDFRPDGFSDYKSGFEVRTTRLCKRVLLFHVFEELALRTDKSDKKTLVKSVNFEYDQATEQDFTFLKKATSYGYLKKSDGSYSFKRLPPMEFEYQKHEWSREIKTISANNLIHAPAGLEEPQYQFTDLFNEGLSGILSEQGNGWYYKHNLGNGQFEQAKLVSPKPSFSGLGGHLQLTDLDGDGGKQLVSFGTEPKGYFELDDENMWHGLHSLGTLPNIDFGDPNIRMLDLNGDGKPEVVLSEDEAFTWYPSEGRRGYATARKTMKPSNEEEGPHIVFADTRQSIFLADMSGDGLTDILRIRNGDVCYWPNLGYGKFGAKVAMDNAPLFDYPDAFNPAYLHLADIDGSGTSDIIYLGKNKFTCWENLSGNRFSTTPFEIDSFPEIHTRSKITVTDLLGNGVACIVWSSSLQKDANAPLKYIDLMKSKKPHLMVGFKNNLGKEVSLEYAPSTRFYLRDKLAGKPWVTKLHFPVHCVVKTTTRDRWRKTSFTNSYSYHHGYYDHAEREFRGFGRVEQTDVEEFGIFASGNIHSPYITQEQHLYQPPVKTITWYHTGAALERNRILDQFKHEYFSPKSPFFSENSLPEPDIEGLALSTDEWREALRACKGMMLRQEIYELAVDALSNGEEKRIKLFSTAFHNCHVRCLQPRAQNRHGIFQTVESEAITYAYELDLLEPELPPDPRIAHTLNLSIDEYGNVLESVAIAYPRIGRHTDRTLPAGAETRIEDVQQKTHLVYTKNRFTELDPGVPVSPDHHRLPMPCETKTYELTGISPTVGFYFTLAQLRRSNIATIKEIFYHTLPDPQTTTPQKRGVEHARILYFDTDLVSPLPFGTHNYLGMMYETYNLALTRPLLDSVFTDWSGSNKLLQPIDTFNVTPLDKLNDASTSGYLSGVLLETRFDTIPAAELSGQYWIRSGIAGFANNAADHFFLPERYTDAFENITTLEYDGKYDLYIQSSTDALGNRTVIESFDFRVLAPRAMKDFNDNLSEVWFDILGLPVAMALKGKGMEGDSLAGFTNTLANPDANELTAFFIEQDYDDLSTTNPARLWLGNATVRHVYYFGEDINLDGSITWGAHPACACGIRREQHVAAGGVSPIQVEFEYSDGLGTVLVKKAQAEPAPGGTDLRWIASGKTILNNKGKPVKQYEPYFSTSAHRFEEPLEVGVTPVIFYDAVGRVVRTEMPDGTLSRAEFTPWFSRSFDANDTVLEPNNRWYAEHTQATAKTEAKHAARLASVHSNTPIQTHLDSLGREVIVIAHNRVKDPGGLLLINGEKYRNDYYLTFSKLDAEGKPLWIEDAMGSLVMQYVFPYAADNRIEPQNFVPCYDISGNLLFQHSMDAGDRWSISDAAGKPMFAWDVYKYLQTGSAEERRLYITVYDKLHRQRGLWLKIDSALPVQIERFEYSDTTLPVGGTNPHLVQLKASNLIGQLSHHYDSSGLVVTFSIDFKGNPLKVHRQLLMNKQATITDWQTNPAPKLESKTHVHIQEYDALNRMSRLFNWHNGNGSRVAVYQPAYNQRGILRKEIIVVGAEKTSSLTGYRNGTSSEAIADIRYDVKGHREYLRLGNGVVTHYTYDLNTFRLINLRSTRTANETCNTGTSSAFVDPHLIQNLFYHYDAVGNITEIKDAAFKDVFFNNQKVEPINRYEYDALYRLIHASGRESETASGPQSNIEPSALPNQFPCIGTDAFRNYTQFYEYDAVGNIRQMRHVAGTDSWTRHYYYAHEEPAVPASNRLLKTWTGSNPATTSINYRYDSHGSMLNLANTSEFGMQWDYRDMITAIDLGNGSANYQYDAGKQRTRKYLDYGNKVEERIYLGGLELYQRTQGGVVIEEIETLQLFDGEQRLLMVDQVLQTNNLNLGVGDLYRYTLSNHLGSATMELDEQAHLISYEEYHPYGTSAYRAGRNEAEVKLKRYRYTGMERDEESGMSYHTARYYLPWLGRWGSVDPIINVESSYSAFKSNPISYVDKNGKQSDPFWDNELQRLLADINNSRANLMSESLPTAPAGPLTPYDVARRQAGTGQTAFRELNNLIGTGGVVQAGHTMQVETSVGTQLARGVRDNPATMMALHSRIDPKFQVQTSSNAGTPILSVQGKNEVSSVIPWEKTNTRHTAQEALIVDSTSRPIPGPVTQAEARGVQVSASEEVLWRTENTPWDQRNANAVMAGGKSTEAKRIEESPAVKSYRSSKNKNTSLPKSKNAGDVNRLNFKGGAISLLGHPIIQFILIKKLRDFLVPEPAVFDPFGHLQTTDPSAFNYVTPEELMDLKRTRRITENAAKHIGIGIDHEWSTKEREMVESQVDYFKKNGFFRPNNSM